jgi:hypothetical protein
MEEMKDTFWSENLKGRDHSEELGVHGRIVSRDMGRGCVVVEWMRLAQDRNQWRVIVNTVMNFRVCERRGIS